jgi:hypothetical protein
MNGAYRRDMKEMKDVKGMKKEQSPRSSRRATKVGQKKNKRANAGRLVVAPSI